MKIILTVITVSLLLSLGLDANNIYITRFPQLYTLFYQLWKRGKYTAVSFTVLGFYSKHLFIL